MERDMKLLALLVMELILVGHFIIFESNHYIWNSSCWYRGPLLMWGCLLVAAQIKGHGRRKCLSWLAFTLAGIPSLMLERLRASDVDWWTVALLGSSRPSVPHWYCWDRTLQTEELGGSQTVHCWTAIVGPPQLYHMRWYNRSSHRCIYMYV